MQNLFLAVIVLAAGMCGQKEPELARPNAPDTGAEAIDEPYIERTNRSLRKMKDGLQDQQDSREVELDDKIGTP